MWDNVRHGPIWAWALRAGLVVSILASAGLSVASMLPEPKAYDAAPVRVDVAGGRLDAAGALDRAAGPRTETLAQIATGAVLGDFETRYNRATLSGDRTLALKAAAARIHGFVLEPGATFDFNAAVGDRTETRGFRPTAVTADRELSGGTCQVASTLHAAVFFAGLPIITRFPHARPSFYIKLGLDSTVVNGAQNLRFTNDRPYPIVLGLQVDDGRVYASVHGRERDRSVLFMRRIDTIVPFEEHTRYDPKLPTGLRLLDQRGVPGFKVTRIRVIHDRNTGVDVRERSRDAYPPTAQLWRVGTGGEPPAGFERPRNDPRPEYVVDEYLQTTQTDRGTVDIIREAGRTGNYGWIEREGLVLRKP